MPSFSERMEHQKRKHDNFQKNQKMQQVKKEVEENISQNNEKKKFKILEEKVNRFIESGDFLEALQYLFTTKSNARKNVEVENKGISGVLKGRKSVSEVNMTFDEALSIKKRPYFVRDAGEPARARVGLELGTSIDIAWDEEKPDPYFVRGKIGLMIQIECSGEELGFWIELKKPPYRLMSGGSKSANLLSEDNLFDKIAKLCVVEKDEWYKLGRAF